MTVPAVLTSRPSAYERHGIEVLSATSLNQWAAAPALWVMQRLLRWRSPQSAFFARGKAVEHGVHVGLLDCALDLAACTAAAEKAFDCEMALAPDPRRENERGSIVGYVASALGELRQYGVPTAYQERIEVRLDDVPVPLVGYPDWTFDQHGLLLDLKTQERLPSAISEAHARQGAVYARARGNYGMRFAYVRPSAGKAGVRSVVVYELSAEDIRCHLEALRQIAIRLGRFLALSDDPHELAAVLVPDYGHVWWSNPITRAHGAAVFGF
jgi:hypothetical protein